MEPTVVKLPGLNACPGPWTGIDAAAGDPVTVKLDQALGQQGTVMVWVRLDRPIVNGPDVETDGHTVLELAGLAKLNFWWYHGYGGIVWEFPHDPRLGSLEVPGLPAPQWLHLCYTWDAAEGRFQGYVNGTPTRIPGSRGKPWDCPDVTEITVDASRWAVAGLTVADRWCSRDEALAAVPSIYRGALDHTLGAQDLGTLDADARRGEQVLQIPLADESDIDGWQMEGPGDVSFEDGWMRMWSTTPEAAGKEGHIVHWCPEDVPADFLLEFDVRLLSDHGLNIIFFCAKGRNGEDALDPALSERTGIFGHYTMEIGRAHV